MTENEGADQPNPNEISVKVEVPAATPENPEKASLPAGHAFQSIQFKGTAVDFFEIWISNLFLSMITCGVYSAWAKVRRVKYFYNNTLINDFAFNYHATGKQIFKGRLIAFAILVVYSVTTTIFPLSAIAFSLAFIGVAPWVMNRSLRFNARMTSWRNVRLNWHGTYGRTLLVFVLSPLLGLLSLGLLMPWISRLYYRYYADAHSFGTMRFKSDARVSDYYKGFFLALLAPAIIALGFGVVLFMAVNMTQIGGGSHVFLQILPYPIAVFVVLTQVTFRIICRNIMVRSLTLGDVATFDSALKPLRVLWIEISNAVVRMFSFGLMVPWTMIRRYKYITGNTNIDITDMSHEFIDEQVEAMSAFSAEFADIEGFEVGI